MLAVDHGAADEVECDAPEASVRSAKKGYGRHTKYVLRDEMGYGRHTQSASSKRERKIVSWVHTCTGGGSGLSRLRLRLLQEKREQGKEKPARRSFSVPNSARRPRYRTARIRQS